MIRHVDAQVLETGVARLSPGIVDADVPIESRTHIVGRERDKSISLEFAQRNDISFFFRF